MSYEDYILGIETVSCRLLQQMTRMDMDWNSVKNWGQLFHVLLLSLQKSPPKNYYVWCSLMKVSLICSSLLYWNILFMGKGTDQKLQHRNDLKQQYLCDTAPLTVYLFIIIECSTRNTRELSKDVLERRTSTGSGLFASLGSGFTESFCKSSL